MFDQLETMVGRYEELGELLSDPQVVNDTKRFMELSREEASLRDTVATYNEHKKVLETISDSEEMLGEGGLDEDMKEMLKEMALLVHQAKIYLTNFCSYKERILKMLEQ